MLKTAIHHRSRPDARYLLFVPVSVVLYLCLLMALNCGCDKARRQVPVLEVQAMRVQPAPTPDPLPPPSPLPTPPDGFVYPTFSLAPHEAAAPTAEPPLELEDSTR